MTIRPLTFVLAAILVTSLPLSSQALPVDGKVLSLGEVTSAISQMTQKFVSNKQRAVNFTSVSQDRMLQAIGRLPVVLDETHEVLKAATVMGAGKKNEAVQHIYGVATTIEKLNWRVAAMAESCTDNVFKVNETDDILVPTHRPIENFDFEYPTVVDASEETMAVFDEGMVVMEQLLVPTQGVSDVIERLMEQHGQDANVNLKDLVAVVHSIAMKVEEQRLKELKAKLVKIEEASESLKSAYHHAFGINESAEFLQWALGSSDVSHMVHLGNQVAKLGSFLQEIDCLDA